MINVSHQVLAHPEKLWVHKSNMHRGIKVKNLKGMLSPCTALVSQWSTVSVPLPGKDTIFFISVLVLEICSLTNQ